ncbi:MAG: hypothetical protein EA378_12330 [Phycisphaerales bacterium]|nr:MAG: hypothetical protein EA378_12330 [Phycisphaerales bacterium]
MSRFNTHTAAACTIGAIAGAVLTATVGSSAFHALAGSEAAAQPADQRQMQQGGQPDIGAMLVDTLRSVEGCLGAEAAQFQNGKIAIIGWFENKAAAERWYNHPMHRRLMGALPQDADAEPRQPMQHIEDPDQPIMVIAAITFDPQNPRIPGPMPLSQISIELYAPLPGGAMINGRLAPEAFKVEHMNQIEIGG